MDHPAVEGHFPNFPIIPGAVLLGWVWAAADALDMRILPEVRSVKYLQPIQPGDQLEIHFSRQGRGIQARIRKSDRMAAQFLLLCADKEAADEF